MSFRLHYLTMLVSLAASSRLVAQNFDWPAIIFRDTTNFNAVKIFDYPLPSRYILLRQVDCWYENRLHINDDISDPAVRKRIANEEHHPYQVYIFRDTALDTLVTMKERNYLFQASQKLKAGLIPPNSTLYELVDTSHAFPPGFYFSITPPLFSSDGKLVYINLTTYRRDEPGEFALEEPYCYAITILVYRYSAEKGWTKFYQSDFPIL